jgi:hypothetical protein
MRTVSVAVPVVVALFLPVLSGQTVSTTEKAHAKEDFLTAEGYFRDEKFIDAHNTFCAAAVLEPKNSKYQSKCRETARAASMQMEVSARQSMKDSPLEAVVLLRAAVALDSSNATANQALAELTAKIQAANAEVQGAMELIARGDLDQAQAKLRSVGSYRKAILNFAAVEHGLEASREAVSAKERWRDHNAEEALSKIASAEKSYSSEFIKSISNQLHSEISEDRTRAALSAPVETISQRIRRLTLFRNALKADPRNEIASLGWARDESELEQLLLPSADQPTAISASAARVSMETLTITREWIKDNPGFSRTQDLLQSRAYPLLRARLVIDPPEECTNSSLLEDSIRSVILKSLTPIVTLDERDQML